jgi:hypothetical protein
VCVFEKAGHVEKKSNTAVLESINRRLKIGQNSHTIPMNRLPIPALQIRPIDNKVKRAPQPISSEKTPLLSINQKSF